MNLGSLFVELGVKGGTQANGKVKELRDGLRDAAIIANQTVQLMSKVYEGTKQLVQENTAWGVSLTNASKDLNISTDSLQRWDYAARLTGAKAGEMDSAFKSLQGTILGIADSGELPDYFAHLMSQMNEVDKSFDADRFRSGDLEYAMTMIRKLANNGTTDLARLNKALSAMGFSDGVSNFLKNGTTNLGSISKNLIVDKNGVKSLDQMYKSLVEIEQVSQVAFADIAKMFDKDLLDDFKDLVIELADLVKALLTLSKDTGLIGQIADFIKTTGSGVKLITTGINAAGDANKKYSNEAVDKLLTDVAHRREQKRIASEMNTIEDKSPNALIAGGVQIINNITSMDDAYAIGNAAAQGSLDAIEKASTMNQIQPTRGTSGKRPGQ